MQKRYLTGVVLGAACLGCLPAHAQSVSAQGEQAATGQNSGRGQQNGRSVLPLPKGITKVISVDSQNSLLVEMDDPDDPTQKQYTVIRINHVYSGGIARLLGGTIIPTELLVSPGYSQGNGNGNGGFPGPSAYSNNGNNAGGGVGFFNPTAGATNGATNNGYAPGANGTTGNYANGYNQNSNGQGAPLSYTTSPSYNHNFLRVPLRARNLPHPGIVGQVPQPDPGGQ